MADQADDLGIPVKPVPVPPRVADLPRPGGGPAHAPNSLNQRVDQSVGLRDDSVVARKLIVGRGTSLSGEITSCDRLVIEGSVEANLQNCQHMEITETGVFKGNAAIDDVEVYGRFEGDLVVRKRLLIRASGHVSGTITYGEIEIVAGGRIAGVIQAHEGPKGSRTIAASLLRGPSNGAGDGHRSEHDLDSTEIRAQKPSPEAAGRSSRHQRSSVRSDWNLAQRRRSRLPARMSSRSRCASASVNPSAARSKHELALWRPFSAPTA